MKEQLQKLADELAIMCLVNYETHNGYSEKDLENATIIFMHFLLDVMYTENKHLGEKPMLLLAETTGSAIRELIISSTGKDMHDIAKALHD
jgi:hypothetical protein